MFFDPAWGVRWGPRVDELPFGEMIADKFNWGLAFMDTDFKRFVVGIFVLHQIVFWSYFFLFSALDIFQYPAFLYRYKIQKKNRFPGLSKFVDTVALIALNQFAVLFLMLVAFMPIFASRIRQEARLPHLVEFARDILGFGVVEEVLFYAIHRLVHWKPLYRLIHKIHHEYNAPFVIIAEYAHPLEQAVANVFPVFMGPIVFQSHIFTTFAFVFIGLTTTLAHHSGYEFPWQRFPIVSPRFHDYHHMKFKVCFGMIHVLDHLLGTIGDFQEFADLSQEEYGKVQDAFDAKQQ